MTELNGALIIIEEILRQNAKQFRFYEALHNNHKKYDKAKTNHLHALKSEQALSLIIAIREAVPDGLGDAVFQRYPNMASQKHNMHLTMTEYPKRIKDAAKLLSQITGEKSCK